MRKAGDESRSSRRASWLGFASVLLGFGAWTVGCGDCKDEQDAVGAFLIDPANLSCQSDDDCRVVHTGCETYRGTCGQSHLNSAAASSEEWASLIEELEDCESGSECSQCLALLISGCHGGYCGGPP